MTRRHSLISRTLPSRALRAIRCSIALAVAASALFSAVPAFGITRSEVMARAQVWVDLKIPYSQTKYRTAAGAVAGSSTGYRTDCSGFTSMCWKLQYSDGRPKSLDTLHLSDVATAITKDELLPGDMMLDQIGTGRHALIFGGWLDLAKTSYIAFEEGGSATGAHRRSIVYPHWTNTEYKPYRLKGIESDWLDLSAYVESVYGSSRYGTASSASFRAYCGTSGAKTVVVCSGETWPDALAASPLAGAVRGPMLLVKPNGVPATVSTELQRLAPTRVIIVGGYGAVSSGVTTYLAGLPSRPRVERIGGTDRYETSALIAAAVVRESVAAGRLWSGHALVATGRSFPDALAASPLAAQRAWPILLSRGATLGAEADTAMTSLGARDAIVLGGTSVMTTATADRLAVLLGGASHVTRLGEADRYKTAAAIATYGARNGLTWSGAGVAAGGAFPDGLAGGVMQGALRSVLLLTPGNSLDASAAACLRENRAAVGRARVLGGPGVVASGVRSEVFTIVRGR